MFYIVHQGRERTLQGYTKIKLCQNTTIMYKNEKIYFQFLAKPYCKTLYL